MLDQGKLSEYSNWKQRLDLHMEPIDLRMASVREARSAERRFCFEVITPQYKRVYQATSEDDMNSWISAVNNALQSAVENQGHGTNRPISLNTESSNSSRGQDIKSALTGRIASHFGHTQSIGHHSHVPHHSSSNSGAGASNVMRRTTVGARPTYLRTNSTSYDSNPSQLLQLIRSHDAGNTICADCSSSSNKVEWVSINLGIVLCIECSGIHRSLGTHITKIRSLTLDTTSFSTDIVELILQIGNRKSNMIWEARLEAPFKLVPSATREQRLRYIKSKYEDREWVNPLSSTLSRYASPAETLLASVKQNDIQNVLYALALGASPNSTDRSRATHVTFLALAAADPAAPATLSPAIPATTSASGSAAGSGTGAGSVTNKALTTQSTTAFPIAELLIQNGGEIPTQLPGFPLSRNVLLYIEQKSGREIIQPRPGVRAVSGVLSGPPTPPSGSAGGRSDTLAPLPSIAGPTPTTASDGGKEREREARLQKRGSAAARLARSGVGGFAAGFTGGS